jgi:hypothetical protein
VLVLLPRYVAARYFWLVFCWSLVLLQAAAARAGLAGMQLGGKPWRGRWPLVVLVSTSIGAPALFFLSTPEVLAPGLAGSELLALFAAGAGCALLVSLVGAVLPGGLRLRVHQEALARCCGAAGAPIWALIVADRPSMAQWVPSLLRELSKKRVRARCLAVSPFLPWRGQLALLQEALKEAESFGGKAVAIGLGLGSAFALRAGQLRRDSAVALVWPQWTPEDLPRGLAAFRYADALTIWRGRRHLASWRDALAAEPVGEGLTGQLLVCVPAEVPEREQTSGDCEALRVEGSVGVVRVCRREEVVPNLLGWLARLGLEGPGGSCEDAAGRR